MESKLSSIINLFSEKNNPIIIMDSNFKIIWSKEKEKDVEIINVLLDEFPEVFPMEKEITLSIRYNNNLMPLIITPFKIDGNSIYIVEIFDDMYLASLVGFTSFWDKIKMSLYSVYSELSNMTNTTINFKEFFSKIDDNQFAAACRQYQSVISSLTEINRLTSLLPEFINDNRTINVKDALDILINELIDTLENPTRIEYEAEGGISGIFMSENEFAFTMLEILDNALFYSPKDTPISIKLYFHNYTAHIGVSNFILDEALLPYRGKDTKLGLLKAQIALHKAGGTIAFKKSDIVATTEITLPLSEQTRLRLNTKLREIHSLSPVTLFIQKIKMNEDEK